MVACGRERSNFGSGLVVALRPPFQRFNSSLRRGGSARPFRRPTSLLAPPDVVIQCEENGVQNSKPVEAAATWSSSFEKLLEDSVGLQTFAEFLKKEFSAENIYFWTACERFRRLAPGSEKVLEAQRIYQRHLCVGASEPVNVDSQGRHFTEQSLQEADSCLFEQAQKQIFNLMKFDSYPRFLKSDLYKQCLTGNIETTFDAGLLLQPPGITLSKLKKSLSNAEDRRRKSLLPWHRKNRSKSKDRGESEYCHKKDDYLNENINDVIDKNDVHSSKSSLISQESSKGNQDDQSINTTKGLLCRVILCNGSTTVVQIRQTETIEQLVNRVLDKRGISYSSFEVYTDKHPKVLSINELAITLAGCEVRIEQRVVFKLDLPNRKVIAVKSKYTKIIVDVLKPILNKYNFRLDQVRVTIGSSEPIDVTKTVTSIDGMRLNVQFCDELKEQAAIQPQKIQGIKVISSASLDEITNKVFKELLHEKENLKYKHGSDRGSVKSEDWGSEHSSGILGKFLRRDSGIHEKKKKCLVVRPKPNSNHSSIEDLSGENMNIMKKPLIAKWKSGVNKLHVCCSESEKLYEGLNRAQNSRIEDQRGTEINYELPDFLKDKANGQHNYNRVRKFRRTEDSLEGSRFYDDDTTTITHCKQENNSNRYPPNYENRTIVVNDLNSTNSNVNNYIQNTKLNNLQIYSINKLSSEENSRLNQSTPSKCLASLNSVTENVLKDVFLENPKGNEPPPLPPKPKVLPIKPSNWGQNGIFKVPRIPVNENTKHKLFLEQPTSSFV